MRDYVIVSDSGCDLDEAMLKKYDIELIPGYIMLPGEGDMKAPHKWEGFMSMEKFYAMIKRDPMSYKTSPASIGEYMETFEGYASKGLNVLYVSISSGLSGAFGFANSAAKTVNEKYPDCKIINVDSQRFGPGLGLILTYASEMRKNGVGIEECARGIEENKNRFHQAGWLDDLTFVARKGRLTNAKAFFGTLAGVKPIGEFDYNGLTTVIGKCKGAKNAFATLIGYMAETIENPEEQTIFIAQSDRYAAACKYKELIEERFHPKAVVIKDVYPNCGINIGPGLMAAYYVGTPISEGLEKEKAIFEKYNV